MSVRNSEIETSGWTSFDIPNSFEDLQKQLATGSYYIQHVLDLADINTRLQSRTVFFLDRRKTSFLFHLKILRAFVNQENYSIYSYFFTALQCKSIVIDRCYEMNKIVQLF